MTTYRFTGTVVSYGDNDQVISVDTAEARLVTRNDAVDSYSYSILTTIPDNLPLSSLSLNSDFASFTVDGLGLPGQTGGIFTDYEIGWIQWQNKTSYVFKITNYNIDKVWYFELGGASLPVVSTIAQANNFNRLVRAGGVAPDNSGFAPRDDILLTSLPNVTISENDDFIASRDATSFMTGAGDDTLRYYDGQMTYDGGEGQDTLVILNAYELPNYDLSLEEGGGVTITRTRWESITVTDVETISLNVQRFAGDDWTVDYSFDEMRQLASNPALDLTGGDDDDLLTGDNNDDRIAGAGGNDTLNGGDGRDTLNGGEGNDIITGGATADDLRDLIYAGAGDDSVDGSYGNDLLYGMDGNDTLVGGFGADDLRGQDGEDVLNGAALADLLYGGAGDDFINGGFGYDRVNGGSGGDKFFHLGVADHGSDWIQDYSQSEGDVLVFGQTTATADQFRVTIANTHGAGDTSTDEAFVIDTSSGRIIWALVDGAAQDQITLQISGGSSFDFVL
ncbi:Hemolysin, plasmid [Shimia thalassica]|uniref:Hemolysin, plasmid n=1 Tax=Shimia thalassica TaxID=1715693 RepID=A0A0P1IBH9_9RHOB|nr:calcium-binding protein [Shimia thalassica]CUJ82764.1 Hemolysin, plasmid [Shimia thalassica]